MKTIWKFPLNVADEQVVSMPRDAIVLDVQVQYGIPCIWALVELNEPFFEETRKFRTIGTGSEVPDDIDEHTYVGTYQLVGGKFVGHVFEVTE